MNSMILGRYVPGNSILHRMDPRAKLLGLFLVNCYFVLGQ